MLGHSIFFNRTMRTITTAFGSLFASIVVARYNYNTTPWTEQERFLLKLMYGQKEKFVQALQGDPTNSEKTQVSLPLMAYNFLGLEYDPKRKQQTTIQNYNVNPSGQLISQYVPVPYNFHYQVYIYVRNIIEGEQILEQILPFFTPGYTLTVNMVPAMGITQAIPVNLNSITYENDSEGVRTTDTRYILWTLDFTVMGSLYGPISTGGGLIKEAITNIYNWSKTDGKSLVLLMNPNSGNGNFIPGEIIFQGQTPQSSNASAIVQDWSNTTNRLLITDAQGLFYTNNLLQGSQSGSTRTIQNYEIIPQIVETIDITPIPPTANIGTPYTYDIDKTFYDTAI